MPALHFEHLQTYRAMTYYLRPDLRVTTKDQAVDFVNERGFVFFWPIKDVTMPSLWAAVAGDRPVPDEHDDPGHVTWRWKDEMLGARRWYYAKVLRKKATFIALGVVPFFYALTENYGEPEEDYLLQYQEGRMTFEAKTVYETLLKEGPLDSISLRKAARLTSRESEFAFQPGDRDAPGRLQSAPHWSRPGWRVEIRLHLRSGAPLLSRSTRTIPADPPGRGTPHFGRIVLALGRRCPNSRLQHALWLDKAGHGGGDRGAGAVRQRPAQHDDGGSSRRVDRAGDTLSFANPRRAKAVQCKLTGCPTAPFRVRCCAVIQARRLYAGSLRQLLMKMSSEDFVYHQFPQHGKNWDKHRHKQGAQHTDVVGPGPSGLQSLL